MARPKNLASKLIEAHLVAGALVPGDEIAIRIDQVLLEDALGSLVMLELEAMGFDCLKTKLAVQYVDHNLLEQDFKNADDHLYLRSACRRLGVWFSPPGNGVSHPLHMARFGKPGASLLGADSHTPAAGALGMLAIGAGGLEVALAMIGDPYHLRMPAIWGIRLVGALPPWVSAKDVILEMLRRHRVTGGVGRIIEYYGPGLACLSAMDRHVIANMGAELGATTTVFPSDNAVLAFLRAQGRENDFVRRAADEGARYDVHDTIDLSALEPLVALPTSPDNVVPVHQVAGRPIYQSYIGSSANPGYRDFAMAAQIVRGRQIHDRVSFDINPTSKAMLVDLITDGHVAALLNAGARLHEAGCNGCIGMGQAPATKQNSLRTVPRNFPGRSGTVEDHVYLVSPETAAASALTGVITDPRTLSMPYPVVRDPERPRLDHSRLVAPLSDSERRKQPLEHGPNIKQLPVDPPIPDSFVSPVLLKLLDNISTDDIMPAGARVLPLYTNLDELVKFAFVDLDRHYATRAQQHQKTGHVIVAGHNYGQGSSREHAALAPRHLGLRVVLAIGFARIHQQNLVNFGVLPLTFVDPADYAKIELGDELAFDGLAAAISASNRMTIHIRKGNGSTPIQAAHQLTRVQVEMLRAGGLIPIIRGRRRDATPRASET